MKDKTIPQTVLFPALFDKLFVATFDQQHASSKGGAILLKAAEARYSVIDGFGRCLVDARQPGTVRQALGVLLGQRVFGICMRPSRCQQFRPARPGSPHAPRARARARSCAATLRRHPAARREFVRARGRPDGHRAQTAPDGEPRRRGSACHDESPPRPGHLGPPDTRYRRRATVSASSCAARRRTTRASLSPICATRRASSTSVSTVPGTTSRIGSGNSTTDSRPAERPAVVSERINRACSSPPLRAHARTPPAGNAHRVCAREGDVAARAVARTGGRPDRLGAHIVLHLPGSTPDLDARRHSALALGARPGQPRARVTLEDLQKYAWRAHASLNGATGPPSTPCGLLRPSASCSRLRRSGLRSAAKRRRARRCEHGRLPVPARRDSS